MEKKKNNIFLIIFIIIIIILGVLILYKMNKIHEDKLYEVMYSKIEYNAKRCYLEKKCSEEFTLSDLYDNKYLDIMYDPISKEELNKNLKINIKDGKVIIDK